MPTHLPVMTTLGDREKLISRKSSKQIISRRLSYADILECALKTWAGQEQIAKNVANEAVTIICEAYERNPALLGSKSKKWILGGLFYLFGQRYGHPKTQKQIARILNTNEVTVRASCRDWIKNFPELWTN